MNNMGVYNPGPKKKNMKVIALAVVCIILAAGLVGVTAIYLANGNSADLKAQLAVKDSTINSLQANNTALQSQLSQIPNTSVYTDQIASLNQQLADLNDQVSSYYNIALMNASGVLFSQQPITQDANATTQAFGDSIYYAGYVVIQATATANTTFAEVTYTYAGTNFDYNQTIGTSGSAVFPVLPGTLLINIGNTNQTTANTITATATYYY
jgi:flagellar basal body-associated protein FliL